MDKFYLLAKMCELKAPGTGNWLKALPTSSRFSIPQDEFRTVMAIHMLLPHLFIMNLLGLRKEQWHGDGLDSTVSTQYNISILISVISIHIFYILHLFSS